MYKTFNLGRMFPHHNTNFKFIFRLHYYCLLQVKDFTLLRVVSMRYLGENETQLLCLEVH